jgi:hypothetical protein
LIQFYTPAASPDAFDVLFVDVGLCPYTDSNAFELFDLTSICTDKENKVLLLD